MKYLRKFETEAVVMMFDSPNVVLVADTGKVLYNVPLPNGVYIQHIDGNLYTSSEWANKGFAQSEANGVAVIDSAVSFVISKTTFTCPWCSNTTSAISGIYLASDSDYAKTDYKGKENTELMMKEDVSGAAYQCVNFEFPNGSKGYLPSAGEWGVAYKYKTSVDSAMRVISGNAISTTYNYWTSTQYSYGASQAFACNWSEGVNNALYKSSNNYAKPFAAL